MKVTLIIDKGTEWEVRKDFNAIGDARRYAWAANGIAGCKYSLMKLITPDRKYHEVRPSNREIAIWIAE